MCIYIHLKGSHMYMHTHRGMCICTHLYIKKSQMGTCTHMYVQGCTCTHIHIKTGMHVHKYMCKEVDMCIYAHIHKGGHTCLHVHIYISADVHTDTQYIIEGIIDKERA